MNQKRNKAKEEVMTMGAKVTAMIFFCVFLCCSLYVQSGMSNEKVFKQVLAPEN